MIREADKEGQTTCLSGTEEIITFRPDGFVDYEIRCPPATDFRSFDGASQDSTWVQDGDAIVVSYNGGFKECELTLEGPDQLVGRCQNQGGALLDMDYVPTD